MKTHAIIIIICGVFFALLFAGCMTQPQTLPAPTTPPITGTWTLTSLMGRGPTAVPPGVTITATFLKGGTVSGFAGCNNYIATYETQNTKLTIGKPETTTNKTCTSPAGIMDIETVYLSNLQGSGSYAINGTQLTIIDTSGNTLLTYQKAGS